MTKHGDDQAFILQENSGWLRYVLWGCAIGFCVLAVSVINAPVRDVGKVIGSVMGVLLFGFSGYVIRTRHITVDPLSQKVTITSKGFWQKTTEHLAFKEIKKVLVLTTFDSIENLQGANVMRERWAIALVLEERSVPVTENLYITKERALRDAKRIQQLLNVEISDTVDESIASLAQNGRKIEAVTLASRSLGMTTTQAKDFVDKCDN